VHNLPTWATTFLKEEQYSFFCSLHRNGEVLQDANGVSQAVNGVQKGQ
jgi:hypothetical protein